MPAQRALLTPFRGGAPNHVGRNLWRKQILPKATIRYRDENGERTIDFAAMQSAITAAFNDGAFDQVPFLIDPGGPKPHDKAAVRDFRGEVKAIVPTETGLDAIVETTPDGTELLKQNPRLGVSARVVERYDRADGKHYPVAVAHVLGTLDPKVTGMKPWESVTDMAEPEVVTIDLSGATYPDEGDGKEGQVPDEKPWEPTEEEKAALKALPQTQANLDKLVAALSDEGGDEEDPELLGYDPDEEEASLDEILAGLEDEPSEEHQEEPVGAGLGGGLDSRVQAQIDLANAQHAADAARIAELEQHNRETAWQHEAADFIRAGVPPKVVELAKPYAMAESSTIDLAGTGEKFDLAKGIREILSEMRGTIDMSEEHAALPQSTTDLAQRDPAVDAEEAKYQAWGTQFAGGAHDQRAAMAELAAKASKS